MSVTVPIDLLPINIALYKLDDDGDFIFSDINVMVEKTENVSKEALFERKAIEVFSGLEEMGLIDVFKRVYKSGDSEVLDTTYYQDERISGWRKNTVTKLDQDTIMAVYEDVTAQEESKFHELHEKNIELQRQKMYLDKSQKIAKIGIWEADMLHHTLYWSDEIYNIVGRSRDEFELSYSNFMECIHPDDHDLLSNAFANSIIEKREYLVSHRILRPDGTIRFVEEIGEHTYDDYGTVIKSIGIVIDVTERKKIEDKITYLNENLQKEVATQLEIIREKDTIMLEQSRLAQMGEMLNMIAHQWRQPLNAISISGMDLSIGNQLGELSKKSIDEHCLFIDNQAQNMSKTIQDLMEFNKPERNTSFSLYKATSQVSKIISSQLKNRNITLEVDIDKEIKIFHNPKNIEHVLLNLIVNARDAFENIEKIQNKKIKIFTAIEEDSVILTVEDNAGGIPENILGKVFDLYFTTKDKANGTGIGLYMAKKMIEGINGCSLNIEVINDHSLFKMRFENVNEVLMANV